VIPHVPATETVGEALEHYFRDGWYLIERGDAGVPLLLKTRAADDSEQSMQFDASVDAVTLQKISHR
jgi:hypothetical protein